MKIINGNFNLPDELKKEIEEISEKLENLENKLKEFGFFNGIQDKVRTRIKFPRGYIRRVEDLSKEYEFIQNEILKRNICYTLQLTDIFRWMINRFDIGLTAFEMLIKNGIVVIASIIEAICYETTSRYCELHNMSKPKKFGKILNLMKDREIISKELYDKLYKLKNKRNRIHLWMIRGKEYGKYAIEDYNEVVILLQSLKKELREFWKKGN